MGLVCGAGLVLGVAGLVRRGRGRGRVVGHLLEALIGQRVAPARVHRVIPRQRQEFRLALAVRLRRRLGDDPRVARGDLPRRQRRNRVGQTVLDEVARQRGVTTRLETRHPGVLTHDPRSRDPTVGLHQPARHLREQTIDLSARPSDIHQTRHQLLLLQTVQFQRRHTHRTGATSRAGRRILPGRSVEFPMCNAINTQPLLQLGTTHDCRRHSGSESSPTRENTRDQHRLASPNRQPTPAALPRRSSTASGPGDRRSARGATPGRGGRTCRGIQQQYSANAWKSNPGSDRNPDCSSPR